MRVCHVVEFIGLTVALTALSGCVTHEIRVDVPAETISASAVPVEGRTVIGAATFISPPGPPPSTVQRGPLPQDVTVTAWRRDSEGIIARGDAQISTALPWWQRFPCDMVTDVVPTELVVRSDHTLVTAPVATHTRAQLDAEAAAAGYALLTPPPQSNP